jgi:deoxyribonuclease-4
MYIGGHIDIIKGNLLSTIQAGHAEGLNCIQIFLANPRSGRIKQRTADELQEVADYIASNDIKLFSHMPYIYNLARPLTEARAQAIVAEITYGNTMGYSGSVIHVGKAVKEVGAAAMQNFIDNLNAITAKYPIILETPAGQGSELCTTTESLAQLYSSITHKHNLSFCIDTCHLFASGYLRTVPEVVSYFSTFDRLIGLDKIALIHMNDSKAAFNSKTDRHASIGKGKMDIKVLKAVFAVAARHNIPICVETQTPIEDVQLVLSFQHKK